MNRFLRYTFLFLVPILLGGVLLETALRAIPSGYGFKKSFLDRHKSEINTLVLGSSHGFYNIDPWYIDGQAFNAANPAQSLRYDMLVLERYISDMPKLQTVILPVGYPTLFFDLGDTPESWRLTHYARDFGFKISPDQLQYQYFVLSKMLKWNLDDIEMHYLKKEKVYKMTKLGWGTDFGGNREGKIEKSAKASIFWHTAPESKHVELNRKYLERIAKLCTDKNIQLLIIKTPQHLAYRERMDQTQVSITESVLLDLTKKYSKLKIVDFSADAEFGDQDFYDGDHLNEVGAQKLSRKIKNVIGNSLSSN